MKVEEEQVEVEGDAATRIGKIHGTGGIWFFLDQWFSQISSTSVFFLN